MDEQMLAQIQQMITTATETIRQEMAGMRAEFRVEMAGMRVELRQEIAGMNADLRQEIVSSAAGLREAIADGKRYAGNLAEDLHHKLELVIEGQQFLGQRIDNVQADLDAKNRETRALLSPPQRTR